MSELLVKVVKVAVWKCNQCGAEFDRRSPGEPRRCPHCLAKGPLRFSREEFRRHRR